MKKVTLIILLSICCLTATAQLSKPYFYYRGKELIIDGKFSEAIESLNMLLRSQPKEYEGYFLRGVAKYNLDDLPGAEADFSSAIAENPVYTKAFQYRAITRSRMGRYDEALADYAWALELRPNMAVTYYSRGITLFLTQQFEAAIADFNRYLAKEPADVNALTNRGTAYLYLKDTTRAMADFNRAVDVNPYSSEGYMRRGLLEVIRRNYPSGIADLSQALQRDSTMAIAYFYRGMAKSSILRPMEALADFDQAIRYDSTNSVTYFNRAILRSQMGDYNRAIEDYDRVARYNPGNVLVFYNRGSVKAQLGDYPGAALDYSRAIELYPDFANAYLYRSQLKIAMGDQAGAQKDRQIADAKISDYRNKLKDSTFSAYADTSRQFDALMAFDADFGNKDMKQMVGDARSEVKLLPLFRLSVAAAEARNTNNPRLYQNARLDNYIEQLRAKAVNSADSIPAPNSFKLINTIPQLTTEEIEAWDKANRYPDDWEANFLKGLSQNMMRQYTSSITYYNRAIRENQNRGVSDNPIVILNRGVSQAEMIDFIASLENSTAMQNVNIVGKSEDPSIQLRQNSSRRGYDYGDAMKDMNRVAELMPELPHAQYNIGYLLCQSGDLPGAVAAFTRAIDLFPYFAEAYFNRGLVQIYMGDTQKGCLDLSKAGELGLDVAYTIIGRYCVKTK